MLPAIKPLPTVLLRIDGKWLSPDDMAALNEIRVQQKLSLPTLTELYFQDPPGPLDAIRRIKPGTSLEITLERFPEPLFVGEITAVEYIYDARNQRQIYLRGYDPLHRLRKRQIPRRIEANSFKTMAQTLVAGTGITEVKTPQAGLSHHHLLQHFQTDYDLLLDEAARNGLYPYVHKNILSFMTLDGQGTPIPLKLGESLIEARVETNTDAVCREVSAFGWDSTFARPFEARVNRPRSGRNVAANRHGRSDSSRVLLNEATLDLDSARSLAQAELDWREATAVTFWGRAEGNTSLYPGTPIEVADLDAPFNGRYILTEAIHTLNTESGYTTELSTTPPAPRQRPRSDIATFGVVLDVADPKKLARVQVTLPAFGGLKTDWIPVVIPGAGKNKGFITLPNIDDTVLVILTRGSPAAGVVIGGLYGQQKMPEDDVSLGHVHQFTWQTAGGQQIILNDLGNVIRLDNKSGAYIELNDGQITIAGKAIDFKST
ncbi:MAG: phage baseplate assembly protein V [Ardenticatenaceae bacterium]|nr:phage baseplate assembly protein V [Ardenticatenaceae bacterium]